MSGNLTFDQLKKAVADGSIDTVVVALVDMQGRLIGKRFHAPYFVEVAHDETHGCDYLLADDIDMEPVPGYAAASWAKGYGDFVMKPDMATLRVTPWLEKTALVLADVQDHHHHDLAHSPRGILKRQIARLAERGMTAFTASELEFYLFDEDYESIRKKRYHDLDTAGRYIQDYHVFQTTKEEDVMRAIRLGLDGAGIPVENSKGEWGPGQEEINVRYAEALEMADRHAILKNGIKEIAWGKGKAVTFMAKWDYGLAGSSSHIHMSLWDKAGKKPLFLDPKAEFGMSALMRRFMAGQLKYAGDITWFLAPYINSYKRFQGGREVDPRRVPDRRRRPQPLPRLRRARRRRPRRDRRESRTGATVRRRRLCRQAPPRGAEDASRGDPAARPLEDAPRRPRRRRRRPLRPHRRMGAVRVRPPRHRLGTEAGV